MGPGQVRVWGRDRYGCGTVRMSHVVNVAGNEDHYGTDTPPVYDLSKVTVPTALFKGTGDDLADPVDVDRLALELSNCFVNHQVEFDGFSHGEFFAHIDVDKLVYNYVLDILKQFQ